MSSTDEDAAWQAKYDNNWHVVSCMLRLKLINTFGLDTSRYRSLVIARYVADSWWTGRPPSYRRTT